MTEDPDPTLSDLVGGIRIAMLTTHGPAGLQSRPMTVQRVDDEGATVWFLVGDDTDWLASATGEVNVAFVDDDAWVSVAGRGSTTTDAAVLADLGDPVSGAYFGDEADPVALRIGVEHVDWWTAPGKVGQALGLAKAAVTQERPDLGDRGEIDSV